MCSCPGRPQHVQGLTTANMRVLSLARAASTSRDGGGQRPVPAARRRRPPLGTLARLPRQVPACGAALHAIVAQKRASSSPRRQSILVLAQARAASLAIAAKRCWRLPCDAGVQGRQSGPLGAEWTLPKCMNGAHLAWSNRLPNQCRDRKHLGPPARVPATQRRQCQGEWNPWCRAAAPSIPARHGSRCSIN